jgi:hypothetical protein
MLLEISMLPLKMDEVRSSGRSRGPGLPEGRCRLSSSCEKMNKIRPSVNGSAGSLDERSIRMGVAWTAPCMLELASVREARQVDASSLLPRLRRYLQPTDRGECHRYAAAEHLACPAGVCGRSKDWSGYGGSR